MKKIATLLGAFLVLISISCEGPTGPPGIDGANGVNVVGDTYEIDGIDFSPANNTVRFTFPQNIVNGDAVLVYRLEDIEDGLDIWEPLPTATIFFQDGGFFQYRFNYTLGDVDIIAESDDLSLIDDSFMLDQIFRIIVVPSDLVSTIDDTANMESVIKQLGLENQDIQELEISPIQ